MQTNPLIVALDFPDRKQTSDFLNNFNEEKLFVKVGMELFYKEGAPLIDVLKNAGHRIFLDLKLHDIPTTVRRAMSQLASLEVDLVNVHALGGIEMMQAAKLGLEEGTPANGKMPVCIAVTYLTSMSEQVMKDDLNIQTPLPDSVLNLCGKTKEAGLDGVVCSAEEAAEIRRRFGESFYTVTPGIRLKEDGGDDQKRVMTPFEAARAGSTAIVVGRGITRAADPAAAYKHYENEWRHGRL